MYRSTVSVDPDNYLSIFKAAVVAEMGPGRSATDRRTIHPSSSGLAIGSSTRSEILSCRAVMVSQLTATKYSVPTERQNNAQRTDEITRP